MMKNNSHQKLVCVGHVCHDVVSNGYKLGGSVSFSSSIARKMNVKVKVVSAFGDDFQFESVFSNLGVDLINLGSKETSCFENIYDGDHRTQYLRAQGQALGTSKILNEIDTDDIVLVSPIINEVDPKALEQIECQLLVCTIQGWLRHVKEDGLVESKPMDWHRLNNADVIILSYEDIEGIGNAIEHLRLLDSIVIITNAGKGADVYHNGLMNHYPAIPTEVNDPTGAGDAFAVAFTIKYNETKDIDSAMSFAHKVASEIIS